MPIFTQDSEPSNKTKKNKMKKQYKAKRDFTNPAIGVNKVKIRRRKKDISEIMYYNYNKKGHYSDKCLEFWKSRN